MDNLGRDIERMMWAGLVLALLAGAAAMFVGERILRWIFR
jgi:ABC-type dipeptide/oligopeptide/nickel transport system permease subunit